MATRVTDINTHPQGPRRSAWHTAGQLSTAWVLNNKLVTSVIVGPRLKAQLNDYLGTLRYRFTAEDEILVNALVAPGHASTPGYTDPLEQVEGRVPRTSSPWKK